MLGTIYLKSQDINSIMVAEGMAWAYRYQGRLTVPEYGTLEQNARNAGKGLWSTRTRLNHVNGAKRINKYIRNDI